MPATANEVVWLRPIQPEDYPFLRAAELGGDIGSRWRFRGSTPGPEQWSQSTWASSLAQFIVMSANQNQAIGLVSLYDPNFQDGFASVAVAKFSPVDTSLRIMSATLLFLDYAFTNWRFRKLYFDVPEFNLAQFSAALRSHLSTEARLKDHMFAAGRYWDRFTLSLFREQWEQTRFQFRALIGGES
ncbi:MAG TPA: GNAT family protein [Solirubrobacterales bacterium]|nr:GNAT family protein [Solirubrobacterales bacterium]